MIAWPDELVGEEKIWLHFNISFARVQIFDILGPIEAAGTAAKRLSAVWRAAPDEGGTRTAHPNLPFAAGTIAKSGSYMGTGVYAFPSDIKINHVYNNQRGTI